MYIQSMSTRLCISNVCTWYMTGRSLLWRRGACRAELRLASVARLIGPDGKWSVVVKLSLYSRHSVCNMYIQLYIFMTVYVSFTYKYRNSCTCMYMLHTLICIHERVCTCAYMYINSWTCTYMSVPCSDTYVPFFNILSRVVGFQMQNWRLPAPENWDSNP